MQTHNIGYQLALCTSKVSDQIIYCYLPTEVLFIYIRKELGQSWTPTTANVSIHQSTVETYITIYFLVWKEQERNYCHPRIEGAGGEQPQLHARELVDYGLLRYV